MGNNNKKRIASEKNNMETNETTKTMTPDELAEYLNICTRTIYRMVQKREIPFIKVRGRVRFREKDIEKYLEGVRVEAIGK